MLVLGSVGASTMFDVAAQTKREVREQAEASMVLTGEIDIGTEGQVEAFRLDKRAQVDETIVTFVEGAVKTWRFAPVLVDGQAVKARTPATIRLGAKNNPDGTGLVTLLAANFETYDETSTDNVTKVKMSPPVYPEDVFNARPWRCTAADTGRARREGTGCGHRAGQSSCDRQRGEHAENARQAGPRVDGRRT